MLNWIFVIFETIGKILDALKAYAPPKATEQKVEDGQTSVDAEIAKEKETGRPVL